MRDERHLDVELREVRLAVGAQVLVAEAAGDLEVAVEPTHHQHLLEELRRLRQRVELAGVGPGRHHEVARALGRGQSQEGSLDLHEAALVEVVPDRLGDAVAQQQRSGCLGPTQVEVAVLEPQLLVDLAGVDAAVDQERRRLGAGQHLQRVGHDLDVSRRQPRSALVVGPRAHDAGHLHHVLAAHRAGRRERCGRVGLDYHLGRAVAVPEVDEDQPAQVAAAVDPALQHDALAGVLTPQRAAVMRSHHGAESIRAEGCPWAPSGDRRTDALKAGDHPRAVRRPRRHRAPRPRPRPARRWPGP